MTIPATLNIFQMGATYPAVVLLCTNCAYVRMHSAVLMGLIQTKPENEPKAEEPKAEVSHG